MNSPKVTSLLFAFFLLQISSCKKPPEPVINTNFTASKTVIPEGSVVTFTDLSTENPTSWDWTFGGGTPQTSSEQNPTIAFENEGVYDVTLIASKPGSSDDEIKNNFISVVKKLEAQFTPNDSIVDEGSEIVFTDLSLGSIINWEWSFEGGSPATSTEQNPSVVFSNPGLYNVTLKVVSDLEPLGNSISKEVVILPTSGLVAYFPFNGNANDESGNNLNGSIIGASLTFDKYNNADGAFYFDGIDDRIEISNNLLLEPQEYTISVWAKMENETGAIVSMSSFNPVNNNCGYYLSILNGNIRGFSNISTSNWAKNVDTNVLSQNVWHHIVFTYDGQNIILYLDGALVSTKFEQHIVNYNENNPVQLGTYSTQSGSTSFKGDLDAIRIYNRALTELEILALFNE